jgi:hypothetical protein
MAKDPVMGPISRPLDPRPVPKPEPEPEKDELEKEIESFEKASDEDLGTFDATLGKLVEEPEEKAAVQLEDERRQTYEYELRTEMQMRPLSDVTKMAQMRGLKFDPHISKERLMALILRAEGFDAPDPISSAALTGQGGFEENVPRYSVRVRRALESQSRL